MVQFGLVEAGLDDEASVRLARVILGCGRRLLVCTASQRLHPRERHQETVGGGRHPQGDQRDQNDLPEQTHRATKAEFQAESNAPGPLLRVDGCRCYRVFPVPCLTAIACRFFWSTRAALACFCDDFFWFAFGDLSPMVLSFWSVLSHLRHVSFSGGRVSLRAARVIVNAEHTAPGLRAILAPSCHSSPRFMFRAMRL